MLTLKILLTEMVLSQESAELVFFAELVINPALNQKCLGRNCFCSCILALASSVRYVKGAWAN
jgi:hypothetical protein